MPNDELCRNEIILTDPSILIPTEEIDSKRVAEIEGQILALGRWEFPIAVHQGHPFVMDGHHRLAVARKLRLARLPVVFFDYSTVAVEAWREGDVVTPESIFAMVRSGKKFPCKTTRHIFGRDIAPCNIPLEYLQDHKLTWAVRSQRHLLSYR